MPRTAILLIGLIALVVSPSIGPAQELTLSVAISMKEAIEEIGERFHGTHPKAVIRYNFGSSGELQKQIEAGAPVDVFVAAAERQMDALERRGLIVSGSRRTFARNALSVIVPADSRLAVTGPADLLRPQVVRIAMGNPKSVPAGQYAEESLRALGLWQSVHAKLVFGENVRQVLEYVARGEVEAGFVYVSDVAARGSLIREAFRPPPGSYTSVTYPAAIVVGSRHPTLGEALIALLLSGEGQAVLGRFGFQSASRAR